MNFALNVLGTASALPTTCRYPSAQVLDVRGRLFLLDCGEAAQINLRRQKISFLKISDICISHIHGDHIFGLFGLLSTMGMLGRTGTLNIYGPRSLGPILDFFKTTFAEGFQYEINHVVMTMTEPEVVMSTKNIELLSFPLNHRIECYGYLIREKQPELNVRKEAIGRYGLSLAEIACLKRGEEVLREGLPINAEVAYQPYVPRSFAYCSDTAPFPELSSWVKGVSLLYHEATFPIEMKDFAQQTFHSTTADAARCALEAGAGKLVIGHYSSRFPDVTPFLEEARAIFPETFLAHEGDIFEVPLERLG